MSNVQSTGKGSIDDPEVPAAVWATIRLVAEQLAHRCTVNMLSKSTGQRETIVNCAVPDVPTWRLVEALSLLGILLRAQAVKASEVTLFASIGPVEFVEDADPRFLWVQKGLQGDYTALGGRPDLLVTLTPDLPTAQNTVRVVRSSS